MKCKPVYFLLCFLVAASAAYASPQQSVVNNTSSTPPAEILKTLTLDIISERTDGAKLYKSFCSRCHQLPHPSLHSLEEWESVVGRMRNNALKLAQPAPSPMELKEILRFLEDYLSHQNHFDE